VASHICHETPPSRLLDSPLAAPAETRQSPLAATAACRRRYTQEVPQLQSRPRRPVNLSAHHDETAAICVASLTSPNADCSVVQLPRIVTLGEVVQASGPPTCYRILESDA
jgi:hypothetical protein